MTTAPASTPKPRRRWFQHRPQRQLVLILICLIPCGWLAIAIRDARDAAMRLKCSHRRVDVLAHALHNYHTTYGCFPPAFVADKNGKPMHSWRVLLLPNLECHDLYRRYAFSEPWDGPKNRLLWMEMPHVYRCPSIRGQNSFSTNYVAVVGPDTVWPGEKSVSVENIVDGTSCTLLIVEVADSDINWMEPRDMTCRQAMAGVNLDRTHGISSNHRGGAICGMANGFSAFLHDDASPEAIKALLTIHGDEPREVSSTALHR